MLLSQKTAVITGGSRGIGKAIALKFAENGANIAILATHAEKAAQVQAQVEAFGVQCKTYICNVADFSQTAEAVKEMKETFPSLDILVNNAGITRDGLLVRMQETQFDEVMDINLKGAFNMIRHISPLMLRAKAGKIINLTSVVGIAGNAGQVNYAASKGGLIALTKSVAKELGGKGILVNAIAPGFVETDMTQGLPDAVKEKLLDTIALKRLGTAEDIANLSLFLASDASNYITGQVIRIDGGMSI